MVWGVRWSIAALLLVVGCGGSSNASDDTPTAGDTTAPVTSGTPTSEPSRAPSASGPVDDTAGSPDIPGPVGACGGGTVAERVECVDAERFEDDVRFIADVRTPGSPHWEAVQELCIDRLTMLGFEVVELDYGSGIDVLGFVPGTDRAEEVVLVGAHYDHIPDCVGADDNATGVAAVLEVARVLADSDNPRTLGIACWDEEELGLVGSSAFVEIGLDPPAHVVTYFNYDMIGIRTSEPNSQQIPAGLDLVFPQQYAEVEANEFRGDFIVAVAVTDAADAVASFETWADGRGLANIPLVLAPALASSAAAADLRRSDHAPFWDAGIAAVFLSDTGELRHGNYHCFSTPDVPDDLDFPFATDVVAASVGAIADTLQ
jgi:hypothetical protein